MVDTKVDVAADAALRESQVQIEHWNSPLYGGDAHQHSGRAFRAYMADGRDTIGMMQVSIQEEAGDPARGLIAGFEVSSIPGSEEAVPTLLMYQGDECVFKLVVQNDGILIVPMVPSLKVLPAQLPDEGGGWKVVSDPRS